MGSNEMYALDKIVPRSTIFNANGAAFNEITFQDLIEKNIWRDL